MSSSVNLADYFHIVIEWKDENRYGSSLSHSAQQTVRERLYPLASAALVDSIEKTNKPLAVQRLNELLLQERQTEVYNSITNDPDFWYPQVDKVTPERVILKSTLGSCKQNIDLSDNNLDKVRELLLQGTDNNYFYNKLHEASLEQFESLKLRRLRTVGQADNNRPLYIGHACVSWSDGNVRLWSDPYLRPKSPNYPLHYQPLSPLDFIEQQHVVMLTHTHADHFDPGSLLLFPPQTTFLIPNIERESLLSVDLDYRLRQLGFADIHKLDWHQSYSAGDFEIHSLPFYGEQPLGAGTHYKLKDFNIGNTYLIRARNPQGSASHSTLLLADSGSDPRNSVQQNMRDLVENYGNIDYVFANHRRWRLYPAQYLTSSVPQYLCYVPDSELSIRQKLMMDPETVDAVAEITGAKYIIPYAMGGARWFEEVGLGFDYLRPDAQTSEFDAHPAELLKRQAQTPFSLQEPFQICLMLPGQTLDVKGETEFVGELQQATLDDFKQDDANQAHAPAGSLAIEGSGLDIEVLSELIEFTQFDPRSFLLVAPEYCEIYYSDSHDGRYLLKTVRKLAREVRLSSVQLVSPLTAGLFAKRPAWQQLFENVHRDVFVALRDSEDIVEGVSGVVHNPLFASLSQALIVETANSLLNLKLKINQNDSSNAIETYQALDLPELPLPEQANDSIQIYGNVQTAMALLLVKVIHNNFLFCCQMDCFESPIPEQDWFEVILDLEAFA
jgi:L-ascorbate metabolism protein UlaG (beta-lactamase superfamily)